MSDEKQIWKVMMKMNLRMLFMAAVAATMVMSCGKDEPYDPAKDPDRKPGSEPTEYVIDKNGYATYEYGGFTYKFKVAVVGSREAQTAMAKIKSDIDHINEIIPEAALKVMKKRPIWFEENNKQNPSAAWYHTWAEYPTTYGDLAEKGKCVEVTNYNNYVDWSGRNQPLMVLHELCHLYHDQALGGETNPTIKNAYENAKKQGLYAKAKYRYEVGGKVYQQNEAAYCMNTMWEYWSEMCEAYWGENDYYPFNYEDLKSHDPVGFAMCEKIWGARPDKQ